jgi:hypothetical protein
MLFLHQEDLWDGESQSEDLFDREAQLNFNAAFKESMRTRPRSCCILWCRVKFVKL